MAAERFAGNSDINHFRGLVDEHGKARSADKVPSRTGGDGYERAIVPVCQSLHGLPDDLWPVSLRYIQDKQGDLSVKELICALGLNLNYKWWERTFKKHLGLSPQRYIQSQRFLYTYIELENSPQKELIEVALNNGYYDMNHMVKNFREYTGEPPRTFFRQY